MALDTPFRCAPFENRNSWGSNLLFQGRPFRVRERACGKLQGNKYSASGRTKKAGILDSGLVDHEMVAGVRFELTTFGLCDLTQLSLRVGLYLHPV